MASKVLVPAAPFAKLQVKKSPPDSGSGFIIGGDPAARVAHLEHSVRFLQEQHRLMLSGLHAEIEALRERNRDLQFQLIFNKESSTKNSPATTEDLENSEEANLRREVSRLEREAAAARGEARAAEARALQLQRLVDAQAEKLRELEVQSKASCSCSCSEGAEGAEGGAGAGAGAESRGELRARLSSAERLVRRLRADAERQRREVHAPAPPAPGGAVTNLLFDGAAARHAHLQCMKNSLHASLRASGLDSGYGYQNNYHFPPVHTADFWREPIRDELVVTGAGARGRARRPLTLPDLTHQVHRSTVYANNHARSRTNGYEHKHKKVPQTNGEVATPKTPEDIQGCRLKSITTELPRINGNLLNRPTGAIYPELKVVVTKLIPREHVSGGAGGAGSEVGRGGRARRVTHRKHAPDHT